MSARLFTASIVAIALLSGTAIAQTKNGASDTSTSGSAADANQAGQQLPQRIKDKLQQQGFTDVQVVPGSFIVSAKDKNGDSVNMIIGPRSMLIMTETDTSGITRGTTGEGKITGTPRTGTPNR
jgi:hypothetical protein